MRILLVEGGKRILAGFDERLATYARERLERLGVEVRTSTMAREIGAGHIGLGDEIVPTGLSLWAAGVRASPIADRIGLATGAGGRIRVAPDLSVPGHDNLFALGDLAEFADDDGRPLPGLAQVAKQQGIHLGRQLARSMREGTAISPFRYASRGNTAIIGRHAAIYEHGNLRLRGWFAWALWAIVHVYLLVGFQHRLTVSVQWLWRYLTYERGARLISEQHVPAARVTPAREESMQDSRP